MRANSSVVLIVIATFAAACRAPSHESAPASGEAGSKKPASSQAKPSEGGVAGLLKALKPQPVVIPEGTTLSVALETPLSSATSRSGDVVIAKLVSDVTSGDEVVLASGTEVRGRVTAAAPSGRVKGRARLAFSFDRVVVKDHEHLLTIRAVDITAADSHKRDAAIVGGGAAAGGIIGALAGGKGGAGKGILIGGAAGTGAVLATKGKEVALPEGTQLSLKLTEAARLE